MCEHFIDHKNIFLKKENCHLYTSAIITIVSCSVKGSRSPIARCRTLIREATFEATFERMGLTAQRHRLSTCHVLFRLRDIRK